MKELSTIYLNFHVTDSTQLSTQHHRKGKPHMPLRISLLTIHCTGEVLPLFLVFHGGGVGDRLSLAVHIQVEGSLGTLVRKEVDSVPDWAMSFSMLHMRLAQ